MSHLVKDLAGSANETSSACRTRDADEYADWVHGVYRGSSENVRCVMGYIVNLIVILADILRIGTGKASPEDAVQVLKKHVVSRRRDAIHRDVWSSVTEAFGIRFSVPQKDLILERIIDLIKQFCVPHQDMIK
ncbi:hypothetical protein EI94DRAFT_1732211 [Lactarius quietus]|nr:hypothetical protein EI94DRAFT_1732211 [Lactarius quietus]